MTSRYDQPEDITTVDDRDELPFTACAFCGEPIPSDYPVYVADDAFCSSLCAHYYYLDTNQD